MLKSKMIVRLIAIWGFAHVIMPISVCLGVGEGEMEAVPAAVVPAGILEIPAGPWEFRYIFKPRIPIHRLPPGQPDAYLQWEIAAMSKLKTTRGRKDGKTVGYLYNPSPWVYKRSRKSSIIDRCVK